MPLKRSLGLTMLTFYGTGMILGAGIYSIIGQAAGKAGDGLWQGFVIAAIAALLTALSYAELAAMYPKAGGEYVYLLHAFPKQKWIAGTAGIIITFAGCASAATVAMAFASYLQHFVELPHMWIAGSVLVIFSGVNLIGIKQSSWVNAVFTLIEITGLILFIWLGWQNPKFGSALYSTPTLATVSSAALIIFAYFGFENIVNLAEETIDPKKTIPRAIFLSLSISTVLYVLVSLAAVALMPPEQLSQTQSALTDAAVSSSRGVASALGGIALFSTANTVLISLLTTSRILYGISNGNSLPKILSRTLANRKTPWVAILLALAVSAALLPLGKVETIASVSSFTMMIAFILVNAALIALRFRQPQHDRPFTVPLRLGTMPILPVLGIAICTVFLFQFDRLVYTIGVMTFFGSAGIYLVYTYYFRGGEVD
jgi:APA family basic amino acid/polyamine antiporter